MMSEIVQMDAEGRPITTTEIVAEGTEVEHRAVLQLVRGYLADFEEFGGVAFEMRPLETSGGTQMRSIAYLNEEHAMLLLAYMKNTPIVRGFKKALVHAFKKMKDALAVTETTPALTEEEIVHQALAITTRKVEELTARVAELEPVARSYLILATADGDVSVADAAKILKRDHGIDIGGNQKLYQYMESQSWVFKEKSTGRWKAYQTQVNMGRLNHKYPEAPYVDARTGELRMGEPTVRVTEKGQHELRMRLSADETTPLPD